MQCMLFSDSQSRGWQVQIFTEAGGCDVWQINTGNATLHFLIDTSQFKQYSKKTDAEISHTETNLSYAA